MTDQQNDAAAPTRTRFAFGRACLLLTFVVAGYLYFTATPSAAEEPETRPVSTEEVGDVEFAILATTHREEYEQLIDDASDLDDDKTELLKNGNVVARWVPVASRADGKQKPVLSEETIKSSGLGRRVVTIKSDDGTEREQTQFLVVQEKDDFRLRGQHFEKASAQKSEYDGLVVAFTFTERGSFLVTRITSRHLPEFETKSRYHLAILLNDELHSAPTIQGTIRNSGQISGDFSKEEIEELLRVMRGRPQPE